MHGRLAGRLLWISCLVLSLSLTACTKRVPGADPQGADPQKDGTIDVYSGQVRISWDVKLDRARPDVGILADASEVSARLGYVLRLPVDGTTDPRNATYHVDVDLKGKERSELIQKCSRRPNETDTETITSDGYISGSSQELTLAVKSEPGGTDEPTQIHISGGDGRVPVAQDPLLTDRQDTREGCGKPRDVFTLPLLPYMTLEPLPALTASRVGPGHWSFRGSIRHSLFEHDPNKLEHWWPFALVEEYRSAEAFIDLWSLDEKCRPERTEQTPTKERQRKDRVLSRAVVLAGKSRSYRDLHASLGSQAATPEIRPPSSDDGPDVGGWTDREGDHLVVVFPDTVLNLRDDFDTARTLAHEVRHERDFVDGFDEKAVAALLTADEYVALQWELERRAFEFERTVVRELANADRSLSSCRESYENITWSGFDHDRWISDHYKESNLRATWKEFRNSASNPAAESFVQRQDIPVILDHWKPYMAER